jgi:hypothetical protein
MYASSVQAQAWRMPAANDATMDAHAATRGRIAMGAAMSGPGIAR